MSALEQEDLPFDPSGTSGRELTDDDSELTSTSVSNKRPKSLSTNPTSLESNISSLNLDNGKSGRKSAKGKMKLVPTGSSVSEPTQEAAPLGESGSDEKESSLMDMFPLIENFTVTYTLKKYNGDVDKAMDVLLNLTFFEENTPEDPNEKIFVPKGVDGFAGGNTDNKWRNKKGKGRNGKAHILGHSAPASPLTPGSATSLENKWDNGKKDVDFICSKTYLTSKNVASAYHLNGASLSTTIHFLALREADANAKTLFDDDVTVSLVSELQEQFPSVPPNELAGLLRIARNSISAANELATALTSGPITVPFVDLSYVAPRPLLPSEASGSNDAPSRKATKSTPALRLTTDFHTVQAHANRNFVAGQNAFAKAGAAYRRGKSDRLMGGAAGYYSAVGRDHVELAKKQSMAAAEALVDSQSTSTVLDLHGVSVQDAVRITSERVVDWWESLGDTKYASGGRTRAPEGYRVITGAGRHSKNGAARIGPAVAKMLAREGWKVEVGNGVLTVTGLVKHR